MNAERFSSVGNGNGSNGRQPQANPTSTITVDIYIAAHCQNCIYAYEVAAAIRQRFPHVAVRIIDLHATNEPIPDAVFATPTYLLNGRVWSLGNPSLTQVHETLSSLSSH